MTDDNCCQPEAGNAPRERLARAAGACPRCGEKGKPVPGQTVKALLAVSLREVFDVEYLFCATAGCPVVYFTPGGEQAFVVDELRERVYQKEPDAGDVFICYCFRHTAGDVRTASAEGRAAILDDINAGIKADQCACDLRNPQGACCLGNVRALVKRLERAAAAG